jgi:2-polyprenyl-3-methyl-5-hydroxy-6-metoxy-1,4-benzoquinol methylase
VTDHPLARFRRTVIEAWAVYAADQAGLFEALREAQTTAELATRSAYDSTALEALLNALAACGYLQRDANARYALTQLATETLLPDAPDYIGNALAFLRNTPLYEQYPRLLREGGAVGLSAAQWAAVTRGSAMYAARATRTLLEQHPELRDAPELRVLDVGCGQGTYLLELWRHLPAVRAVGVDPEAAVIRDASVNLEQSGAPSELRVQVGTIEAVTEKFDLVMMNQVFHVVGLEASARMLHSAKARVGPGGLLAAQEIVVLPDDPLGALGGFNMRLLFPQGLALTVEQMQMLLRDAGLADVRVIPIEGPHPGLLWVTGRVPS